MTNIVRENVTTTDTNVPCTTVVEPDTNIPITPVEGIGGPPTPEPVLESITITENGTYIPPEGVDGYNNIDVDVPTPEPPTSEIVVDFDYTIAEYDKTRSVVVGEEKEKYNIYAINNFVYENNGMTAKVYWAPSYTFEQLNNYEIDITFGSFANCSTTNNKVNICGIMNKSPYGISGTVSGGQGTVSHCEIFYNYSQDKWYIATSITGVSSTTEIIGSSGLNYFENRTIKIKIEWKNIYNDIQNVYELYETITLIDGNNSYIMFKNFMPATHVVQELFNSENLFIGNYEGASNTRLENFILKKVKITKIKPNIGGN